MIVNFDQIINEVCSFLQMDRANVDANVITTFKLRVNQIQDRIIYWNNWEWRKRKFYLTTKAPYTTGTISITQGNRTVTGSGTSWDSSMEGQDLAFGNVKLRIKTISSTTELILEAPCSEDDASGLSYKVLFSNYILNHEISSIIDVKLQGGSIDIVKNNSQNLQSNVPSIPTQVSFGERTYRDQYNTGTVNVTNGSTTVTGIGTTFPTDIEGTNFRVNEHSKLFTIASRNGDTSLTLEEAYDGDTGTGKAYAINPKGSTLFTFHNSPDDYYSVEIDALVGSQKLVSATDYSIIPNHNSLLMGAIWLAAIDFKSENPVRIQQAQADFKSAIDDFKKQYKIIGQARWSSEEEALAKRSGFTNFNPLSSN